MQYLVITQICSDDGLGNWIECHKGCWRRETEINPKDIIIFSGFQKVQQHLSVDLLVINTDGRKPDPCHASVYYLNKSTNQEIRVHVYYNASGTLGNDPALICWTPC